MFYFAPLLERLHSTACPNEVSLLNYTLYNMNCSNERNIDVEREKEKPLSANPFPDLVLLEANAKFRDEILAFKPQELLNGCK